MASAARWRSERRLRRDGGVSDMVRKELAISAARWMSEQLSEGGSRDGNFCSTRGYPARLNKE